MQENIKVNQLETNEGTSKVETPDTDTLIETLWTIKQRVNCLNY